MQIAVIQKGRKKAMISSVKDAAGEFQTQRQDVAYAFAEFYESLYKCEGSSDSDSNHRTHHGAGIAAVTTDEVAHYLKKMCKRKAADTCGIVVEFLQEGGDRLASALADLFTDLLMCVCVCLSVSVC